MTSGSRVTRGGRGLPSSIHGASSLAEGTAYSPFHHLTRRPPERYHELEDVARERRDAVA